MIIQNGHGVLSKRSLILASGIAAVLTLAACSGASSPTSATAPAAASNAAIGLLDRLNPVDVGRRSAVVVNLRQVRSLLGLPANAPTVSFADAAHRHYTDLLFEAVPILALPYSVPALKAIDFGQVTAAANNGFGGREQVVVLATTQSFGQLADALSVDGYTRSGDLLHKPVANFSRDIAAIAGTPGIIALGTDPAAVRAAAEGHAHGISGPVRDALVSLNAPAAEAVDTTGTCMTAIAISDNISSNTGRLLILTDTPQAARLTAASHSDLGPPLHLGAVTINGRHLTVPYTYRLGDTPPFDSYINEMPLDQIYRCS